MFFLPRNIYKSWLREKRTQEACPVVSAAGELWRTADGTERRKFKNGQAQESKKLFHETFAS